jgi:hypothetical protein
MPERSSTLLDESAPRGAIYTVEVSGISEDLLQRLDARARERGSDRGEVIREIITRELVGVDPDIASQSFDAALASLRAGFAESGMSEAEAEELLDKGLRAVRAEGRQTRNKVSTSLGIVNRSSFTSHAL